MYCLEVRELVIVRIDTSAEEETRVSAVHDLGVLFEFDEIGLVFLISRCYEAVDLKESS